MQEKAGKKTKITEHFWELDGAFAREPVARATCAGEGGRSAEGGATRAPQVCRLPAPPRSPPRGPLGSQARLPGEARAAPGPRWSCSEQRRRQPAVRGSLALPRATGWRRRPGTRQEAVCVSDGKMRCDAFHPQGRKVG